MNSETIGLILAGGRGIRMRRLGEYMPKCALTVYDQPLLVKQLESLRKAGIQKTYVSYGPKYEKILKHLVEQYQENMQIHSSPKMEVTLLLDDQLKGPINGLQLVRPYIEGNPCLFFLGDIYLEKDDFVQIHGHGDFQHGVLSVYQENIEDRITKGCNVHSKGSEVVRLMEKPKPDNIKGNLCWTGITFLPAGFFEAWMKMDAATWKNAVHIGEIYQALINDGFQFFTFHETGAVINLTTPDDVLLASAYEIRNLKNKQKSTADLAVAIKKVLGSS